MQKLCCVRTRQHSLPVWIISSQVHHHISTNSQPFLVGIVSRPNDAYHLYRGAMGSSAHILKFSFQSALFSLSMAMGILFSMFRFAKSVFRVLKCEVVNFDKYPLACANSMSISSSWHPMYTDGGQLACMCMLQDACITSLYMRYHVA